MVMVSLHHEVSEDRLMKVMPVLGIDISKKKFDVALLRSDKLRHKHFNNDKKGFQGLSTWLVKQKADQVIACMESTGIYGEALSEYLFDQGHQVSVVNPSRIKGFAQSEMVRVKTDKVDATVIARFCAAIEPASWTPPPKNVRQLRDLVRRLDSLNAMHQQESNRLEAVSELVEAQVHKHLNFLEAEIKTVKALIRQRIDDDPDLREKRDLLDSIPGIGEATISTVLSEFSQIDQFKSAKALAAYVGVTPKIKESGSSVRGRSMMSKMGRSKLRKSFFMPALVALRYNPIIVELKERLTKAGKAKMAIVGAAMRKLIHIIYGVLKHKQPFRTDYA
jgi:transposase